MGAGIIDNLLGLLLFILISGLFTGAIQTEEFALTLGGILAFIAGIMAHKYVGRRTSTVYYVEKSFMFLLVPFFFVGMGILFSFQALIPHLWMLILVVLVAIAGKMAGSLSANLPD